MCAFLSIFPYCAYLACAAHRSGVPVCANVADTAMIRVGLGAKWKRVKMSAKRTNAHIENVFKCLNVFCPVHVEYAQMLDPFL